jgi:hypothetical protein
VHHGGTRSAISNETIVVLVIFSIGDPTRFEILAAPFAATQNFSGHLMSMIRCY